MYIRCVLRHVHSIRRFSNVTFPLKDGRLSHPDHHKMTRKMHIILHQHSTQWNLKLITFKVEKRTYQILHYEYKYFLFLDTRSYC